MKADSKALGYDKLNIFSSFFFVLLSGSMIFAMEKFRVLEGGEDGLGGSWYRLVDISEAMMIGTGNLKREKKALIKLQSRNSLLRRCLQCIGDLEFLV